MRTWRAERCRPMHHGGKVARARKTLTTMEGSGYCCVWSCVKYNNLAKDLLICLEALGQLLAQYLPGCGCQHQHWHQHWYKHQYQPQQQQHHHHRRRQRQQQCHRSRHRYHYTTTTTTTTTTPPPPPSPPSPDPDPDPKTLVASWPGSGELSLWACSLP